MTVTEADLRIVALLVLGVALGLAWSWVPLAVAAAVILAANW